MWLKQSVAATIKVGPFLDDTDGKTAETALAIIQADIRLSKNGATFAQSNNAAGATHDALGYYDIPLNTTDTDTLGRLKVAVSESGALPVWQDFMVVPGNVWDSLFGADRLQVHTDEITAGLIVESTFANNAITDAKVASDVTIASVTGSVASVTAGVTLANDAITAAKILADAFTADKFATNVTAEFQAGLATAAALAALNNISEVQVNTQVAAAITAAALATAAALTALSNKVGTPILANVALDIAEIQADTNDLQTKIGVNGAGLTALATSANLAILASYIGTNMPTLLQIIDGIWDEPKADHAIANTYGDNLDAKVSSKLATSGYTIPPTVGAIADAIWDEAQAGHVTAGTFGVNLDVPVSTVGGGGGGGDTSAQIWSYATRTLTSLGVPSGIEYTYTITHSVTGLPIPNVSVWFSTNAEITNVVWYGVTDAFGIAKDVNGNKPRLDVGTYYVLGRKAGFIFTVDVETVS